ncbi:N-6 DNA methylase [Desulfonatronospira thiodismutans ASO3-1]|uniref:site-specific DNA-methyltransferase (adenine-specific) n=1 Tax=Desulfonatronospira thiodismutans ASO3-1 TaxID=555779 RepID=D6SJT6_9BACT|nr:class I SAM-dependent DNA methyltransferase [Desulfonatronospira thiodismutans]EFI36139.1 N-6 DNA methylase [Desulfonatronospira thiodismutans ASO3-1]
MNRNGNQVEARLWAAADELRANSKLKPSEYSVPVLGLVFLRYADHKFKAAAKELECSGGGRRKIGPADYHARGVVYLPEKARFSYLIQLPEGSNLGAAINDAMRAIEAENTDLREVLPKTYNRFENYLLKELLKTMNSVPMDIEGDAFGKIYEYFLGNFARAEGQKGGEFFTPTAIVKLIVGIIEPYHGRIYDPACGSGGMFVQSAHFVEEHRKNPGSELSIYGQEKVAETVRLGKMNLAVHGLGGDIRQGNAYYEDLHNSKAKFEYVMANPPFNVDRVDKDRLKDDPRFPFGLPKPDNANFLWIQMFYSALNDKGRAGFVMANSASDARGSELDIRKQLIESNSVDVMVAVGSNFFYTVTLPCTLWFLDRGKKNTDRADKVLFIDARHIYRQIDRAHRDWTPAQIEFLANIARLYRNEEPENLHDSQGLMDENFPDGKYVDVPGLCKGATLEDIEAQGWSLNPGRYVGVAAREEEDFDFKERLEELNEELEGLNVEARELEERIAENVVRLLEKD